MTHFGSWSAANGRFARRRGLGLVAGAALLLGVSLAVANVLAGQSFVEACPFVDPPPLACRGDDRASILTSGIACAAIVCVLGTFAFVLRVHLSRGAVWLLAIGGTVAALLAFTSAVILGVSQRL